MLNVVNKAIFCEKQTKQQHVSLFNLLILNFVGTIIHICSQLLFLGGGVKQNRRKAEGRHVAVSSFQS